MSTKHKRARNSEGVNDTPAKKKQKLSQSDDDDLQSQIKAMEKLKKERSEAIAVLTAKQEKEMEALTEKYDAEIETLEQKLREKSLCPECYKEPNDECTDCGLVFCGDCVDEDEHTQCSNRADGECDSLFCKTCLDKPSRNGANIEDCCGRFWCRHGCLKMHRKYCDFYD
mmetsp:Transcript_70880/g.112624  ORF Transcript_70880/g.112624 Transcript_70880/m.112624 type:complete len:170 (+) Transcript_70880:58-567(+)